MALTNPEFLAIHQHFAFGFKSTVPFFLLKQSEKSNSFFWFAHQTYETKGFSPIYLGVFFH